LKVFRRGGWLHEEDSSLCPEQLLSDQMASTCAGLYDEICLLGDAT
jgi:hypothetical protein